MPFELPKDAGDTKFFGKKTDDNENAYMPTVIYGPDGVTPLYTDEGRLKVDAQLSGSFVELGREENIEISAGSTMSIIDTSDRLLPDNITKVATTFRGSTTFEFTIDFWWRMYPESDSDFSSLHYIENLVEDENDRYASDHIERKGRFIEPRFNNRSNDTVFIDFVLYGVVS